MKVKGRIKVTIKVKTKRKVLRPDKSGLRMTGLRHRENALARASMAWSG